MSGVLGVPSLCGVWVRSEDFSAWEDRHPYSHEEKNSRCLSTRLHAGVGERVVEGRTRRPILLVGADEAFSEADFGERIKLWLV